MFTAARYKAFVPENAAEGTPIVRVEAASPSGKPIMYTIVAGNTDELFDLDYSTGKSMNKSTKSFWQLLYLIYKILVLMMPFALLLL